MTSSASDHRNVLTGLVRSAASRHSARIISETPNVVCYGSKAGPSRRSGVALVITLIMLSIITFIAVTFLLIANRERRQVSQSAALTVAETAANSGRERAVGEILARLAGSNDLLSLATLISTNVDIAGTDTTYPSLGVAVDPRAPVFPRNNAGILENRFYLDLNRNRRFDPTVPDVLGDPEWIGVLRVIGNGHEGDNRFLYRYAYIALPEGSMLDLNASHNQAKRPNSPQTEGYLRNQGFGPWEINLAAFLTELNTNYWNYQFYNTDPTLTSSGTAFEDALDLFRFRVNGDYRTGLPSADLLFGAAGGKFGLDRFDSYGNGPVQHWYDRLQFINLDTSPVGLDVSNQSWPGGSSTNKFFTPWDLFDPNKTSVAFTNRLQLSGQNTNTGESQVFYRMISQLGLSSTPLKLTNFINLSYDNIYTNVESLTDWDATAFFNTVADRLIRQRTNEFGFTITNILIWEPVGRTNLYSKELHQILQMTANIYDATRNDTNIYPDYPTVFRPIFRRIGQGIYIVRYEEVKDTSVLNERMLDLTYNSADQQVIGNNDTKVMVWGVPLIIGARKGYPNFNEFSLQTYIQVTRKLEFRRPSTNSLPNQTNQMWVMGISNTVSAELWNSYTTAFPRPLEIRGTNFMLIYLTNELGYCTFPLGKVNPAQITSDIPPSRQTIPAGSWREWNPLIPTSDPRNYLNFRIPIYTNLVFLPDAGYFSGNNEFRSINPNPGFDRTPGFTTPKWALNIRNYANFAIIDNGRIVDYVNLQGLDSFIDITKELIADNQIIGEPSAIGSMWITNRAGGGASVLIPPEGIVNQIEVCLGNRTVSAGDWRSYSDQAAQGMDKEKSIDTFRVFMGLTPLRYQRSQLPPSGLVQQSPFSPTRKLYVYTSWQANDPLVHYRLEDLVDPRGPTNLIVVVKPPTLTPTNSNIGRLNTRYQPWGGNPQKDPNMDPNAYNRMVKDPLVRKSDDWDFPHTKFPSIGWLGRVHRGTPWQTIYFKSESADLNAWHNWAGGRFPRISHPTNDWLLADIFTIAPHPDATRGLMPINQTNLASWSAALSGILVVTNDMPDAALGTNAPIAYLDLDIKPNTLELFAIWNGINRERANMPRGRFERVSDLLRVPELTVTSPFLNTGSSVQMQRGLSDFAYEIIPQKLMSLLKVDEPRYVIYAWGQSLRPANQSLLLQFSPNDPRFQMCTNYVVTGEVATRTVVRFEDADPAPGRTAPRAIIESFNILPPE